MNGAALAIAAARRSCSSSIDSSCSRMFEAIGHQVSKLKRVAIGPIRDERLRPGETRRLAPEEIAALRASLAPTKAPVKGPASRRPANRGPANRGPAPKRNPRPKHR